MASLLSCHSSEPQHHNSANAEQVDTDTSAQNIFTLTLFTLGSLMLQGHMLHVHIYMCQQSQSSPVGRNVTFQGQERTLQFTSSPPLPQCDKVHSTLFMSYVNHSWHIRLLLHAPCLLFSLGKDQEQALGQTDYSVTTFSLLGNSFCMTQHTCTNNEPKRTSRRTWRTVQNVRKCLGRGLQLPEKKPLAQPRRATVKAGWCQNGSDAKFAPLAPGCLCSLSSSHQFLCTPSEKQNIT